MSPSDIERRRRAIVAALRDVMAEPFLATDLATVTPIRSQAPAAIEHDPDPDDDLDGERASVPPFEPAGEMSEIASNALFGSS